MAIRRPVRLFMTVFIGVLIVTLVNNSFYTVFEGLPKNLHNQIKRETVNFILIKNSRNRSMPLYTTMSGFDSTWDIILSCESNHSVTTEETTTHPLLYSLTEPMDEDFTYYMTEYNKTLCPQMPPNLGRAFPNKDEIMDEIKRIYSEVDNGGYYKPIECVARQTAAIIVPHTQIKQNHKTWLHYMHPFLMKQQLEYRIFIIQQDNTTEYSHGKLLNIGYVEATKMYPGGWQCIIFHDAHLLPLNTRNLYRCNSYVNQLFVGVDSFKYAYLKTVFGGAIAMTPSQLNKVNGFTNNYFGQGPNYEDMHKRISSYNYTIKKSPTVLGTYTVLEEYLSREPFMNTSKDSQIESDKDGLSHLSYEVTYMEIFPLHTYIVVKY